MTTPTTQQSPQHQTIPVASPSARREWCCGTAVTEQHAPGCVYDPEQGGVPDPAPLNVSEPPPAPPVEVPAAASPRSYGFAKSDEFDLELPSGSLVRCRKLTKSYLLSLNLIEVMDGFTSELMEEAKSADATVANAAALKAITDPERNAKIFGPVDRVVVSSVVIPTVVRSGATGDQVCVDDIDLEDKLTIFDAAIGEQLAALKSVRVETTPGL